MKLFDTDVLIEHLKGNRAAISYSRPQLPDKPHVRFSRFELLAGMRSNERSEIRGLLASMDNLEASVDIATRAGEWARTYRRSHVALAAPDHCWNDQMADNPRAYEEKPDSRVE